MNSSEEKRPARIAGYFTAHPEIIFLLKVIVVFIAVYLLLEMTRDRQLKILALLALILAPLYIAASVIAKSESLGDVVWSHLSFITKLRIEERCRTDCIAWTTYALIAANVVIHYGFTADPMMNVEGIVDHLVFLPVNPAMWNTPVSLVTSMFLHGSDAHLWGNMFFLWGVGPAVERRMGAENYITLYITTGIIAAAVNASLLIGLFGCVTHGLGASGAIAGVMGVFMVRCYFKNVTYRFPGFLPVNLKAEVNSVTLFGLFFFMDLSGVIDDLRGGLTRIGHGAHLWGMLGGYAFASWRGLAGEGIAERNLEAGLESLDVGIGLGEGEQSLRAALENDPGNLEAMLALARMKSKERHAQSEEARQLYEEVIGGFIGEDPEAAAEIYQEYRDKYEEGLEPPLHYRIAGALYNTGEYDSAARSYEELANREDAPAETREKALYRCARILDEMGMEEGAERFYEQFLERFPESAMVEKVRRRI